MIPVLVFFVCPILNAVISPKTEYLVTNELFEIPVTVNDNEPAEDETPKRSPVIFGISDQMKLLAVKSPPVLSVVQL